MHKRVCPWWMGYVLVNPIRRWYHNPGKILGPYVQEGMTVLDLGCGMGFFSLEMARLVGKNGRVIAVDLQEKMLAGLRRRAERKGLSDRIETYQCRPDSIDAPGPVDFALAFAVAHEVPDPRAFFSQIRAVLKPGARLLLVEPGLHVSAEEFKGLIKAAGAAGLKPAEETRLRAGHSALLAAE